MPQISRKVLKSNIKSNQIEKLYYFYGKETFLMNNFTNKILEVSIPNYRNSIDFMMFNTESLDLSKVYNFVNTLPVISDKRGILIKLINPNKLDSSFFETLKKILDNIPEFCIVIINDFTNNKERKNKYFINFVSHVSKISQFVEFKSEEITSEKQAILWAKKYGKTLSQDLSKLLCNVCQNDLNLIKNSIDHICISCNENEVTESMISDLNLEDGKTYNIFDISKSIRDRKLDLSIKILNSLISQKEDPVKILSIISMDFIDAFRVMVVKKSGRAIDYIFKIFDYKGKEFRIKNAEILCKNYNVKSCIEILLNADLLLKTTSISPLEIIDEVLVKIFKF